MTSLKKLEKLKQQQQMQEPPSHLAIEQPQQLPFEELAASDVPVLCKMHLQASGILPVSQPIPSAIWLSIRSSTETGPEASLSVSHASAHRLCQLGKNKPLRLQCYSSLSTLLHTYCLVQMSLQHSYEWCWAYMYRPSCCLRELLY